jgi:hypothetical protein
MTLALLAAFAIGSLAPQVAAPTQPGPAENRARAPAAEEPETRRVCRFETTIGSNRRVRVCRDVPRQGVQDQQTREFMRDNQRVRTPDGG